MIPGLVDNCANITAKGSTCWPVVAHLDNHSCYFLEGKAQMGKIGGEEHNQYI